MHASSLKFLTDAPDVQRALRAELTSVLDDSDQRPLTYSDVNSDRTPFLEAVVAETLRCGRVAEGTRRQSMTRNHGAVFHQI